MMRDQLTVDSSMPCMRSATPRMRNAVNCESIIAPVSAFQTLPAVSGDELAERVDPLLHVVDRRLADDPHHRPEDPPDEPAEPLRERLAVQREHEQDDGRAIRTMATTATLGHPRRHRPRWRRAPAGRAARSE